MDVSLLLLECILKDTSEQCSTTYDPRDMQTINLRVENEGLSFLTITLPNFLQDIFKCLEEGKVTLHDFSGWKKRGCLPVFLQGFTKLIFSESGRLHETNSQHIYATRAVRQICSLFKKKKELCSEKRIRESLDSYCQVDDDMYSALPKNSSTELFMDTAAIIVSQVFKDHEAIDLIQSHGPGATADKINGNRKFSQSSITWLSKFDKYVSKEEFLYNTEESAYLDTEGPSVVEESYNLPCRLSYVPKTMKVPRIIALEPCSMQSIQQPIKDYLVDCLEQSPLTQGHVNFKDQSINRRLALENSLTKKKATIDLSAASDRISTEHVYLLFSVNPGLRDLLFTARSEYVDIFGSLRKLNKFASMGSALCFPVESIYFYTLCISSILERRNLPPTYPNIYKISRDVHVYGDDIIVPVDEVDYLCRFFDQFRSKVGLEKSFKKGYFRESCGMDAYAGVDITPTYLRASLPTSRKDVDLIISSISFANQCYKQGYARTTNFVKKIVENAVGSLPTINETDGGLGWHFGNYLTKVRTSKNLQRREVRTLVVDVRPEKDEINGYAALQKSLLRLQNPLELDMSYPVSYRRAAKFFKESTDKEHLKKSYGFGNLALKSRWIASA